MPTERSITTSRGTSFRVLDSGAPTQADYLTLVFLHGWGLPSVRITERIAALAPAEGARFIGVNRRGYFGSSPYTPEEACVLEGGTPEERAGAYRDEGLQYVYLLDALVQDGTVGEGGVALIGWSVANAHLNATIAAVHDLPGPVRDRLSQCVKAFIYFEASPPLMGIPLLSGLYMPIQDESVPLETREKNSKAWYASYFTHNLAARDVCKLETRNADPTRPASDSVEAFDEKYLDLPGALPGDQAMFAPELLPHIKAACDAALFDESVREAWGRPKVVYMWGESSVWTAICTAWKLEGEYKKRVGAPEMTFKRLEQSNHYAILDRPEETLRAFLDSAR
ncbi:Alpha/Beta hydrolase protein [Schizophyllum amplum]|uniref:Alpha/Beta hydrolase protein n=1 Tax=Schizophyllum amplum TaxID=97359 RepID=A0A550C6I4_9AGAR|nr:Alpha/Beta hydrolase protein [Auriculariopsis ampla]